MRVIGPLSGWSQQGSSMHISMWTYARTWRFPPHVTLGITFHTLILTNIIDIRIARNLLLDACHSIEDRCINLFILFLRLDQPPIRTPRGLCKSYWSDFLPSPIWICLNITFLIKWILCIIHMDHLTLARPQFPIVTMMKTCYLYNHYARDTFIITQHIHQIS